MYRILSLLWLGWVLVGHAAAQDFPSRPVMFTVPFAAGGPADVIARILANGMSKVLNQQFVVENTVGAGGTIGTAKVASSPSDGYSLLLMHISHAANVAFCPNLRYDPVKDFEPIGLVAESPMAIVARKNFPASNFKEFITYLSANNDKMTYGFAGIGSASHLCSLLFFHAINTTVNGAPYKGTAPALNDLLGGHLDFMCDQTINVLQPAKSGLVKAFAATTPQRLKVAPDLPTIAESGLPDFQMVGLVRNVRAERDAKAGHRQAFGCTAEGSAGSGGAGTAGPVGRRDRAARAGEAGRSARSSQGRNRQVGTDHQESVRTGAVAFRNRAAEVG